jgi:signal transduction histidine kinase
MKESQPTPTAQNWNARFASIRIHPGISRWFAQYSFHFLARYFGAVLLSGASIAATFALVDLMPTFAYPGSLVILATLMTALLWGAGPSLLATLLEALLLNVVILPPQFSWSLSTLHQIIETVLFLLIGFIISLVASRIQQARAEAVNAWQRLHDLFMQAPANIVIFRGPHHRFELANSPYLKTAGRSDVLGKTAREVFPEAEQQKFMHLLDHVYATGVPFAGNEVWAQMRSPEDGTMKEGYFNFVCQPTRAPNGEVDGLLIHGVEVTEQVRARQRIEGALDALLTIAEVLVQSPSHEGSPQEGMIDEVQQTVHHMAILTCQLLGCEGVGVIKVELESGYLQPLTLAGYSSEEKPSWFDEAAHLRLSDYLPLDIVARLLQGEVILNQPSEQTAQDTGADENLSLLIAPLCIDSHLLGMLLLDWGSTRHIHAPKERALAGAVAKLAALVIERERLLREYTEARANELAALAATRRMDTFLAMASHELRTPLTVIKGNLQLARWSAQPTSTEPNGNARDACGGIDPLPELLAHAEQQANRLTRLVNDLTEVSRLHTDTIEMQMEVCDLGTIVHEMVEEQRVLTPRRTILELDSSCLFLVYADAERVGQVVTNYLTNALKYSPEEQPVEVRIERGDRDVRILVHDRGYGLTPLQQEQIWERFHRVEEMKVQSGSSVGLGLGLYISRVIVEQHQGHVGVESAPNEGSTFWFTLPSMSTDEEEEIAGAQERIHEAK